MAEKHGSHVNGEIRGALGVITLDRPRALNAISLGMIRDITALLDEFEDNNAVKAVLIRGEGGRAFCAGGDIKHCYEVGRKQPPGTIAPEIASLFGEEYTLNKRLFSYPKTLIALMDGVTMGGGFGIAGPCDYRIATEKTVFAMPEVGIGLFPDVGSTWFLNRCPGESGGYIVVTGASMNAADMLYTGLATNYIEDIDHAAFIDALAETLEADYSGQAIEDFLAARCTAPAQVSFLQQHQDLIDECFGFDTVAEIIAGLAGNGSEEARAMKEIIAGRSPTSLVISLKHLRMADEEDFSSILERDFTLAQACMKGHDFYEGVRAAVIDKDKNPQWQPARLENVDEALVRRHFEAPEFTLKNFKPV